MNTVHKLASLVIIFLMTTTLQLLAQTSNEVQLANEYYGQGEYEKAKLLYEILADDFNNIPLIHNNYFFLLLETADYNTAAKYLKKLLKQYPRNWYYKLDYGLLVLNEKGDQAAAKYFNEIIQQVKQDNYLVSITADYFVTKQLTQYAIQTFEAGRAAMNNPYLFSLEMANIYRIMNEKDKMVEEYLNYVTQNPSNLNAVKNTLQNLLSKPEELESLEHLLYSKIQQNPQNDIYGELLIWVNLQQKNFYGAFMQARALDRRMQSDGARTLNIGLIALDNNDYNNSIKIFSYLIQTYPSSHNYLLAKMYLIRSYEQRVRNTYPIDEREIRNLITDYNQFINELGVSRNTLEALRNKALLHAFYLDEKDSAIQILQKIVDTPRAGADIKAKSKLDLGDIYLLIGQPWESSLLYSQVEKSNKETDLGYLAKLKNAQLSYYKGEFKLAEEHLDILKEATTREISNDAIQLSLLIKDNTALDTSDFALQQFAKVQMLLYQNKLSQASAKIDTLLTNMTSHPLMDELLYEKAQIAKRMGDFTLAVDLLEMIVATYGSDILGDDAYFQIAEIYHHQLEATQKAMEYYQNFLTRYPGSVFVAEARKRFRELRGDFKPSNDLLN